MNENSFANKGPLVGDKWKLRRDYYLQVVDSDKQEIFKTNTIIVLAEVDNKLNLIIAILNNGRRVIFRLNEFFIHMDAFDYMGNVA